MIDPTTFESALYDWISGATGGVVILADQSKPRPITPYALYNIISFLPQGTAGKEFTDLPTDLVQIDYATTYDITVSLNFYRENSFLNASKVRDSLDTVTTIEDLNANGLYFSSTSEIRHIPDVVKKTIEERHQFDVSFYIRSLTSETIEQIKKIQVTNELDGSTVIVE